MNRTSAPTRRRPAVILALLLVGATGLGVAAALLLPGAGTTAADGVLPSDRRVSVHDVDLPAVGRLDPALLDAVQRAADAAAQEGVEFHVTSGWRSVALQAELFRDAVRDYGSEEEAARWAATPETSAHVTGDALDLGDFDATYWLSLHGAAYGLCQIYANESWHFELRPDAVTEGCPPQYPDPTHDPRMRAASLEP